LTATKNTTAPDFQVSAFPNPFSGQINLSLTLGKTGEVSIQLFDGNGRTVGKLFEGELASGEHLISSELGTLPAGIYFARVIIDNMAVRVLKWVKE
ncbi:MAG: T9SS type A sorting domain-containing protein, partial [Phaeodactylibacter sp.]|nr:T9SS type A sorting domain-containing protein [Phaeodactylibacter sp.]